jgi:hypothetical protein
LHNATGADTFIRSGGGGLDGASHGRASASDRRRVAYQVVQRAAQRARPRNGGCAARTIGVQVEFTRGQFTLEFYFTFPLAFVFGKLKSRWVPLSERFKGYSGKKKCYQTNSAQCLSVFNLL